MCGLRNVAYFTKFMASIFRDFIKITMYKLLSFLLNSDTFISTCIWLAERLISYNFTLINSIIFQI